MSNYMTEQSTQRLGAEPVKEQPQFVSELEQMAKTLTLLGELQDRMYNKLSPVRNQHLSKAEPVAEPASSTAEAPLVTSLKQLNYQATLILRNFSDTYDEIDL